MNSSGTVIDHINYDAFGVITSETSSASGGRLKYAGYESDSALGLAHAGARYYDPAAKRWLEEDPISYAGGDSNLYRYVGNGPTNGTDPSGKAKRTDLNDTQGAFLDGAKYRAQFAPYPLFQLDYSNPYDPEMETFLFHAWKAGASGGSFDHFHKLPINGINIYSIIPPIAESDQQLLLDAFNNSKEQLSSQIEISLLPFTAADVESLKTSVANLSQSDSQASATGATGENQPYDANGKRQLPRYSSAKGYGFDDNGEYSYNIPAIGRVIPTIVCHGRDANGPLPRLTATDSFVGGKWHHSGSNDNIIKNHSAGCAAEIVNSPFELANAGKFVFDQFSLGWDFEYTPLFNTQHIANSVESALYPNYDRGSVVTGSGETVGGLVAPYVYSKAFSIGLQQASGLIATQEISGAAYLTSPERVARYEAIVQRAITNGRTGEAVGKLGTRVEMMRRGYLRVGEGIYNGSGHGIDAVYRSVTTGDIAVVESKFNMVFNANRNAETLLGQG